jgi:integrase
MWAPARARAGLKRHVQFHDCRRTLGQRILDATGNIVLAQHQLRHASVRTTEKLYAKKPMDLMREAVRMAAANTTPKW